MLWKTHLRGHNLDSLQLRTKPKDALRQCISWIPAADVWTVNGISLTPLHNKTPNAYIVLLDPQHQLFLQPLSTEFLMPITLSLSHFLSKFFFTLLHLNLKLRCPNTYGIVSENLRDSLFVDNGPWQPWRRSF